MKDRRAQPDRFFWEMRAKGQQAHGDRGRKVRRRQARWQQSKGMGSGCARFSQT